MYDNKNKRKNNTRIQRNGNVNRKHNTVAEKWHKNEWKFECTLRDRERERENSNILYSDFHSSSTVYIQKMLIAWILQLMNWLSRSQAVVDFSSIHNNQPSNRPIVHPSNRPTDRQTNVFVSHLYKKNTFLPCRFSVRFYSIFPQLLTYFTDPFIYSFQWNSFSPIVTDDERTECQRTNERDLLMHCKRKLAMTHSVRGTC